MTRDERFFPSPNSFRPERYETKAMCGNGKPQDSEEHSVGQDDPSAIVFGFGRR